MKKRIIFMLSIVLCLTVACSPVPVAPAPTVAPAPGATPNSTAVPVPTAALGSSVPDNWQTYLNPLGFSIRYPSNWKQQTVPEQSGETIHTVTLLGPEGNVDLHWGVGFGGACPQGYTTVKVAQGELPTCYALLADGTEVWAQMGKILEATSFSADARTSNANPTSHDLVLQILSTLDFSPSK